METEWNQPVFDGPRAKRRSRVQSACQRCRRQKLKCDQHRPCSLCLRAEVPCISESRQRRRKIQRLNSPEEEDEEGVEPQDSSRPLSHQANSDSPHSRFSHGEGHDHSPAQGAHVNTTPKEKLPVSLDRLSATDPDAYNQRISSAGLTQEIIDNFSPDTILESSTSALPGGIGRTQVSPGGPHDEISVEELLGLELPSKRVADYFLNNYLDAVHWFMMLFHEPTFRSTYDALMTTRRFPRCRSNRVIFILLVLSLGAHYAVDEEVRKRFPTFQLQTFRRLSLKKIEDSLHSLYDAAELESVQVCSLLGSFYLYNGRPNLAFVVLGAGLRCAQLMWLHKESAWRGLPEIVKEERRRVFWALFVFDRFAATIFGRPCVITVGEIDVKIPQNVGDTTVQHPGFCSTATMPDGMVEPVTTFAYMKYKFKLYQISSPIIGDLYFHRSSSVSELATKVHRINEELLTWFNALPPELKLEELCRNPGEPVTPSTRPFILQALALQIAYDNVQILLHRPLLSQDLRTFKNGSEGIESNGQDYPLGRTGSYPEDQLSSQDIHQILVSSRDRCFESAIRSSKLGRYHQCLVTARDSHAAAFLGINLFTAGMVLCVIALARPLSSQAQMAKQAIARIMSLSRFLSGKALLSAQTTKILNDLVRLIGEKEIKAMLSASDMVENVPIPKDLRPTELAISKEPLPEPSFGSPNYPQSANGTRTPLQIDGDLGAAAGMNLEQMFMDNFDFSGLENMDFTNGITSLQQAMFPPSIVTTPEVNKSATAEAPADPWSRDQYNIDQSYPAQIGGGQDGLIETDFNMMNTVGQTWLWDTGPW